MFLFFTKEIESKTRKSRRMNNKNKKALGKSRKAFKNPFKQRPYFLFKLFLFKKRVNARNLILVTLILVNFFGFLVITRYHDSFEGSH